MLKQDDDSSMTIDRVKSDRIWNVRRLIAATGAHLRRYAFAVMLVVFGLAPGIAASEPLQALGLKIVGDAARVRVVVEFDRKPERADKIVLASPYRLAVDLPETVFAFSPDSAKAKGMLSNVRYGLIDEGHSRLILSFGTPFVAERMEVLANEGGKSHRLVIDAVAASREAFDSGLSSQLKTGSVGESTTKGDRLGQSGQKTAKPFTVVIDPGHGGIDPGAKGVSGTVEKDVTLDFGRELKDLLQKTGLRAELTRDRDVFLRLDERVRVARQHEADLLVSIHADTIRVKGVRGATVYTISDKASDNIAAEIAEGENKADEIAGMPISEEVEGVADILIDLARRETQTLSIRVAQKVVSSLKDKVELISNPHRSAGFRVLKAPDVPSILLELGYLSNKEDEVLLRDKAWRLKVAGELVEAIESYARIVQTSATIEP
jgi:N-acetylmuramoyl-L-alanine amidase